MKDQLNSTHKPEEVDGSDMTFEEHAEDVGTTITGMAFLVILCTAIIQFAPRKQNKKAPHSETRWYYIIVRALCSEWRHLAELKTVTFLLPKA